MGETNKVTTTQKAGNPIHDQETMGFAYVQEMSPASYEGPITILWTPMKTCRF